MRGKQNEKSFFFAFLSGKVPSHAKRLETRSLISSSAQWPEGDLQEQKNRNCGQLERQCG